MAMRLVLALAVALLGCATDSDGWIERTADIPCQRGGCSGQLCTDSLDEPVVTTCEFREEYACFDTAACERQVDGECGFTLTPDLAACLGAN